MKLAKMVAACLFAFVDQLSHLTVDLFQILYMDFINLCHGFCPMNSLYEGHYLSVSTCGCYSFKSFLQITNIHSLLLISHPKEKTDQTAPFGAV